MDLTTKLEKLVSRLEKIETQPADIARQQIEGILDGIYPLLEEEYQSMVEEAYKDEELDKDAEQIINKAEDLFVKVDTLIADIQTKIGFDIEDLGDSVFDDELERSVYDEEMGAESVSDEEIEYLFNEVAKSALHKIGHDDSDPRVVDLMGNILAELASGEKNDDIIVGKVLAPLVLSGYAIDPGELKNICSRTRDKCGMQVLGLQIAIDTMREYKCSAYDALMQISNLLQ